MRKLIRIGKVWRFFALFFGLTSILAIVLGDNSAGPNTFLENNRLKKNRVGSKVLRERLLRTEMNQLHLHENSVAPRDPSAGSAGTIIRSGSGSSSTRIKSYPPRPPSLNSLHKLDYSLSLWDGSKSICHTVPGLTRDQLELCLRNPEAVTEAIGGLQMAAEECAHQMERNRWNCSSLQGTPNPHSTHLLQKGYRESAFGQAIAAAGVAYAVAKACSQGKLLSCGCGLHYDDQVNYFPSKEDADHYLLPSFEDRGNKDFGVGRGKQQQKASGSTSWKWSGCSHNMDFGMKFAKLFLDAREKSSDLPSRINLHNNRVGRLAVAANMEVRCKCHGLSGSCELRTCWRSAPNFRRVGSELKAKFRRAVLIDQSEFGNRPPNRVENNRGRASGQKRRQRRDRGLSKREAAANIDLWYYEKSPTYCESNTDFNIPGTSGRRCNRTIEARDAGSCSTLCCGRGYNTIRQVYTKRCNCNFLWCCEVICQSCVVDEWITVCK